MGLTESEKDLLIGIAKNKGYEGEEGGRYVVHGVKTTARSLLKDLGMPECLKVDGLYRVFADFPDIKHEILGALSNLKYINPKRTHTDEELLVTDGEEKVPLEAVRSDIRIFKTAKKVGSLDPDSRGMSLILINIKSRTLINGNIYSIDGILDMMGTNRLEVLKDPSVKYIVPFFNPYTPDLTFETTDPAFSDVPMVCLNTAIPPRWMTHRTPGVQPAFKGFIEKLITHLFPKEEDREGVLDWCHYAIFKRNGTVLCLAGDRGTGKSTFVEILSELVGSQYSEIVSEAILKERFNSAFRDKRLVVFEEVALDTAQSINKVKAWCNNKISIEAKGSDAVTADNFSSMVFLLNNLAELKILPQERRFSIPVVAEENLLTAITEKEIAEFKQGILERSQATLDAIAEFGEFLRLRKPKNSEYVPIKGPNFMKVSDLTLSEWQAHLRDFIQAQGVVGKIIPITAIFPTIRQSEKDTAMKYPTKKPTIDSFLRDYRFDGTYKMGDLVDIKEDEMVQLELEYGIVPGRPGTFRSRRLYGIRPKETFLKAHGLKYKNVDDLL